MEGVYDLSDKDTGDAAGDSSFVIAKKNNLFYCRQNPNDFMCNNLAQFSGDDINSTDKILDITIETDGQWGPYLECNPLNSTQPKKRWTCENGIVLPPTPGFPAQCKAANFHAWGGYCNSERPSHVVQGTQADCCSYIATQPTGTFSAYNYFANNSTCHLFKEYHYDSKKCDDGILATYDPPDPNQCECERMYKAVGRQNQTTHSSMFSVAGGLWFSHPSGGECGQDQEIGDGSGCTYKVLEVRRAINATCMYNTIDTFVEGLNPKCFAACPPHNVTTDCYLGCYSKTTSSVPKSKLVEPWVAAFSKGGCPTVPIN